MSTLEAPATAEGLRAPHLTQFLGPRYWLTWLFVGWLRLTAALPWQVAIVIHRWIGRAVWHLLPGRRLVVVRNLEICFPELDPRARLELARRSFENAAISVGEVGIAWFSRQLPPVRVEGREHLEAALAKGNGVILLSGHFTTLELTGHFVKPLTPRIRVHVPRAQQRSCSTPCKREAVNELRICPSATPTPAQCCARCATTPPSGTRPIKPTPAPAPSSCRSSANPQ